MTKCPTYAVAVLLLGFAIPSPFANAADTPAKPATAAPATTQPADPDALSPEDAAVEAKLAEHLTDLRFNAVGFSKALDEVSAKSGIKIDVDWTALNRVDVKADSPVTAKLHDIKISKTLELLFKSVQGEDEDHQLGYRISNGVVRISSKAELNKLIVTRTYDITDFLAGYADHSEQPVTHARGMSGLPAGKGEAMSRSERMDELKKYIIDNVDVVSWKDNGGDVGEITGDAAKHRLEIVQTPEAQRKVQAVLKELRKSIKANAAKTP